MFDLPPSPGQYKLVAPFPLGGHLKPLDPHLGINNEYFFIPIFFTSLVFKFGQKLF